MNIVTGSRVRVNVNLSLRRKPSVKEPRITTIQAGVSAIRSALFSRQVQARPHQDAARFEQARRMAA